MVKARRRRGRITVTLAPEEARAVRVLVADVVDLIRGSGPVSAARDPLVDLTGLDLSWEEAAGAPVPPEGARSDAAVERLFPSAYDDAVEPGAAADFRRLTEGSLRDAKVAAAEALLASLPEEGGTVVLADDDAHAWLAALNDVRLVLGSRLGVTEDTSYDLDPSDPRARMILVYAWLGYLQQQVVDAVTGFRSPF